MSKTVASLSLVVSLAVATPALAQAVNGGNNWPAAGWIAWLCVGLIAGFLASLTINRHGEGFFWDIVLGIVGAYIGGIIFHAFGQPGVTGFNAWSIVVAFLGAVVLLVIYHAIMGRPSARHA
ncbi:MAG TPA: GlsB/YeaQ/YmgE family stress response membrane protein [Candidatus Binataceae bacterium]|nr:GlsB/YeaQ/YmgE family stress response membrane protein [Candidatus Binataceae bacterium]